MMILGVTKHANGIRWGGYGTLPYFCHPVAVLNLIHQWEADTEDVSCGALGHDLREETDCTVQEIVDAAGQNAADIIEELTFFKPDTEDKQLAIDAKDRYLSSFGKWKLDANCRPVKSIQALIIKLADRICNTLDFINDKPEYAVEYWTKANCLFEAFSGREHEILQEFGPKTIMKIKATLRSVQKRLDVILSSI